MKSVIVGAVTFFVLFVFSLDKAWSIEKQPLSVDFEFEEKTLEPDQVVKTEWFYEVNVGKKGLYRIEHTVPDVDVMRAALGLEIPEDTKEEIRKAGGIVPNPVDPLEAYNELNTQEKLEFEHTRLMISRSVARALHHSQGLIFTGSLISNSLSYAKAKLFGKEWNPTKEAWAQKKQRVIEGIIRSLNYTLFYQAPLVLKRNEFGVVGSIGGIGLAGSFHHGRGGLAELGFSLGYNSKTRALVFQVLINPEKFKNTIMPVVSVAGINFKAGGFISYIPEGRETMNIRGQSFYPPAAPGFKSTSPYHFAFGFSSGLGLPPPPIADGMTFTNSMNTTRVLRVSISPFIKGFVNIGVGEVGQLISATMVTIKEAVATFKLRLQEYRHRPGAQTCEQMF